MQQHVKLKKFHSPLQQGFLPLKVVVTGPATWLLFGDKWPQEEVSDLQESMSSLGVSVMAKKAFIATEKKIGK